MNYVVKITKEIYPIFNVPHEPTFEIKIPFNELYKLLGKPFYDKRSLFGFKYLLYWEDGGITSIHRYFPSYLCKEKITADIIKAFYKLNNICYVTSYSYKDNRVIDLLFKGKTAAELLNCIVT